jgi:8-hydroxy-5-deazaflavin:NADPH oxidoreductase
VNGGPLAESWRQQPGTPVYGADLDAEGVVRALSEASPERPEAFRAEG